MTTEKTLSQALAEQFPSDTARVIEEFSLKDGAALLTELAPEAAARVLIALSPNTAMEVSSNLSAQEIARILSQLPLSTAAAFLRRLGERAGEVFAALPAKTAATLRRLTKYPPNTAGALMDPEVLTLAAEVPTGAALEAARTNRARIPHYLYLTDREGRLAGVVRPMDLAVAAPETPLADIATHKIATLRDHDELAVVAAHPGWTQWRSLPVVDRQGLFLGAVRHRAVRQILSDRGAPSSSVISLSVSLAELFWLGLTGITEGFASTASRSGGRDAR